MSARALRNKDAESGECSISEAQRWNANAFSRPAAGAVREMRAALWINVCPRFQEVSQPRSAGAWRKTLSNVRVFAGFSISFHRERTMSANADGRITLGTHWNWLVACSSDFGTRFNSASRMNSRMESRVGKRARGFNWGATRPLIISLITRPINSSIWDCKWDNKGSTCDAATGEAILNHR
jgi:hypothetical protein